MSGNKQRPDRQIYSPREQRRERNLADGRMRITSVMDRITRQRKDLWKINKFQQRIPGDIETIIDVSFVLLHQPVKKWMREVGEGIASRISSGFGLKLPCTLADIFVIDGFARLPRPCEHQEKNCMYLEALIEQFRSHWQELFDVDTSMVNVIADAADNKSLQICLDYLVSESTPPNKRLNRFKTLMAHARFGSAHSKITLLENIYRFLKEKPMGLAEYTDYKNYETFDILAAIRENPIFVAVYYFHPEGSEVDDDGKLWSQYKDSPTDLLLYITNFLEHVGQTCRAMEVDEWSDEVKEGFLEMYFPEQIHEIFFFLWINDYYIVEKGLICKW